MPAPTFELYKLLVEEVREARKARRDLANVFTTINVAGVGLLGTMSKPSEAARRVAEGAGFGVPDAAPVLFIVIALLLTCLVWWTSNAYYTKILAAKYGIVYAIENEMGSAPIQAEWKALGNRTLFKFFSLERMMPVLFAIGYVVFFLYQLPTPGFLAPVRDAITDGVAAVWR